MDTVSDSSSDTCNEGAALLPHSNGISTTAARPNGRYRVFVHAGLILIVLISIPLFLFTEHLGSWTGDGGLPSDPLEAADVILSGSPIIVCSPATLHPVTPAFLG
jgi:hypothetical protein